MPPTIVAHRGLHDIHPENSLAAFRAAWDAGIEWCECDVQESVGGEWIVIHDDTLDRTTNGAGPIWDHETVTLSRLRLKRHDGSLTDERLPLLTDLLRVMRGGEALLLEVKTPRGALWRQLAPLGNRRIVIHSFHREVVEEAARFGAAAAFLTANPDDLADPSRLPGGTVNARHDLVDHHVVKRCRAAEKSIGVWTVNALADMQRVIKLGVDRIITDNPSLAREAVLRDRRRRRSREGH
jgi:glycerophosphoryl diester phosphodiesterase